MSLSSTKDKGSQSCNYVNGGLFSKYSGSAQSLASVRKTYFIIIIPTFAYISLISLSITYLLLLGDSLVESVSFAAGVQFH